MSPFKSNVLAAIKLIPKGTVASYGQIALMVGVPQAARQIGWILHSLGESEVNVPWWRVINNAGRISIKGLSPDAPLLQKSLLEKEGVAVKPNLNIDIEHYRYKPSIKALKKLGLDDEYVSKILEK
ncbi:hypothetical protein A3K34_04665 [candidate division WWE3 bacterium RIFOXYC1_FULL_40_10]|uniref:Methylated-DNA-[protein]-cysteine S-methyltransferase DNA binding domain-containing protein n=1 Tax=candidate division WWE3 bacterium RIFOXYA2_FULL_46_9 TaxID=1802636 RepID=A0A1F4W150_UNCKA|nr:MAG: hypothetical protein A3K58_04665 [candidate division WWE3 bacterium RIFOXYB1_FULL_40_22]OGC62131.1 MAG: hypothetical protein A3K37_04665 [candidate division WWE3 bacterium RIFOXYA1_FULL_40_11]OGC63144.1 MAG: hypothetical protein A2264_00410 [candidate division WWE3 bacterium RIFOXYA2_FULL_46_9]OGC64926.1 MAG: hypothetical protein A2326_02700 [candidate division WWE3 bacterium RIFOXYB2_FULL_41_6]OGC66514.1 MAG: hypothetical protein A3K34_04665 [candidate division WWE3 bacterium RIFOXYC1_